MKTTILTLLSAFSLSLASWNVGMGFGTLEADPLFPGVSSMKFDTTYLSLSYRYELNNGLTLSPIARIGKGVSNHSNNFRGLDFEVDVKSIYGVGVELEKAYNEKLSLFYSLHIGMVHSTYKDSLGSDIRDEKESASFGFGTRYKISNKVSGQVSFELLREASLFLTSLQFSL